ncbi:MAG: nickel ABC transporter permease subunit NikC [Epulopiscium sp. Nuni2H_MBin003]|nr:MAG: nickel ABC transporter permease subunit NikC [Epulopiscium sp. Nuni2H_MBin003]
MRRGRDIILIVLLLSIIGVSIFAPFIVPFDPNEAVLVNANQPPDNIHWFGTDKMGRDVFSRVIYGARTSLASTAILVTVVFVVGGTLGIIAGYVGGKTDAIIMRISDMMVSFPGMALAIAMAGMLGPSIINAIIAIAMVTWTKYARLSRSLVLKIRNMDYIKAARLCGSSHLKIMIVHLIPAVLPTLIITVVTDMGGMMLELAGFSFLGLGANASSIEWGYMLNEGRYAMMAYPWLMLAPGGAIFITVMMFNFLGDGLRDRLDPKWRR